MRPGMTQTVTELWVYNSCNTIGYDPDKALPVKGSPRTEGDRRELREFDIVNSGRHGVTVTSYKQAPYMRKSVRSLEKYEEQMKQGIIDYVLD